MGEGAQLRGLHKPCLCEDKQRKNPLGQGTTKAPVVSQLLCLALLEATGQSAMHMGSQEGGVIHTAEQDPACGGWSGPADAQPSISRWALCCALLLSYGL